MLFVALNMNFVKVAELDFDCTLLIFFCRFLKNVNYIILVIILKSTKTKIKINKVANMIPF